MKNMVKRKGFRNEERVARIVQKANEDLLSTGTVQFRASMICTYLSPYYRVVTIDQNLFHQVLHEAEKKLN